jgi:hypothetical protein
MTFRDGGANVRLVGVFPDRKNEVGSFIQRNNLNIETIDEIDLKLINVPTTPTIVLVDATGRITNFWIGRLSEEDKQEILNTLSL